MSENLLPCLFCGGESKLSALRSIKDLKIADRYYIVCLDCGVQTAMLATIEKAIAAWNRRAVPQETKTPITESEIEALGLRHAGNGLYYLPAAEPTITIAFYTDTPPCVSVNDTQDDESVILPTVTTMERLRMLVAVLSTE